MTPPEIINLVLTPAFGGLGAYLGMRFLASRQNEDMKKKAPMIGIAVAAGLFVVKLMGY